MDICLFCGQHMRHKTYKTCIENFSIGCNTIIHNQIFSTTCMSNTIKPNFKQLDFMIIIFINFFAIDKVLLTFKLIQYKSMKRFAKHLVFDNIYSKIKIKS